MCLGMRASRPTVYKRPNPQDIYYNGNIFDPKPEPEKEEAAVAMKDRVVTTANSKNKIY